MKRAILFFVALTGITAAAQVLPPPVPAAQVIPQPTLPPPSPTLPPTAFFPPATTAVLPVTNAPTANLSDLLTNLQVAVQQALPVLANFNDSFDFVVIGSNGLAELVPDTGTNLIVATGTNLVTTLSPNGMVAGTLVTNATSAASLSRGQVAGLLILENDLERLLPLLNTLNGLPPTGTNVVRAQ